MSSNLDYETTLGLFQPQAARLALRRLHRRNYELFQRLFLFEEGIDEAENLTDFLVESGLVAWSKGAIRARVRVWPQGEDYYTSDLFTSNRADRVYPVYLDQAAFFVDRLLTKTEDVVLDIGAGSGVLGLAAAKKTSRVRAIDPNPRAVAFTRFNASMNGRVLDADVSALEDPQPERYSLVLCNPPFTAVPEKQAWFDHGSSGYDGHDTYRTLLMRLPDLLHEENGRSQILINSLGTKHSIQAVDLAQDAFPQARLTLWHLFSPRSVELQKYARRFRRSPRYGEWMDWLRDQGFTRVYRFIVAVDPAGPPELREIDSPGYTIRFLEPFGRSPRVISQPYWSGGWSEMLLRYGARAP